MNYGEVLSNAWKIIWKHKVLWLFGVLAGLGSGGGFNMGGYRTDQSDFTNQFTNPPNFNFPEYSYQFPWGEQVGSWFAANWWIFIFVLALIFLAIIVFVVLSTFGRIGLTRGAWKADGAENGALRLSFGELFSESGHFFWRVIGLALLIIAVSLVLGGTLAAISGGLDRLTGGAVLACLAPFFCVLGIVGWFINIVLRLAVISIAGEDVGIFEGLRRAWNAVRVHLGEAVVMGLILGIGAGVVSLVIAAPFIASVIPLVIGAVGGTWESVSRGLVPMVIIICAYMPVAVFLGGVLESYVGTAWTLTYRRFTARPLAAPPAPAGEPAGGETL